MQHSAPPDLLRYADDSLDRLAELRGDPATLGKMLDDPTTRVWPVWRGRHPVIWSQDGAEPQSFDGSAFRESGLADQGDEIPLIFLGRTPDGRHHIAAAIDQVPEAEAVAEAADGAAPIAVAIDAKRQTDAPDSSALPTLPETVKWNDLRAFGQLLDDGTGALLAYARAMCWWHMTHRFCSKCGSPAQVTESGHSRTCSNPDCARTVYPRTDPAVIVAVTDGDRILLGRQANWPPGMHSVLAGFTEAGESLEATVRREVAEESGIRVTDIRYRASQPWPFPQSLMLGFTARAVTTDILRNDDELEDASWYSREQLLAVDPTAKPGDGVFCLPRVDSIARRLVEDWLGRRPL